MFLSGLKSGCRNLIICAPLPPLSSYFVMAALYLGDSLSFCAPVPAPCPTLPGQSQCGAVALKEVTPWPPRVRLISLWNIQSLAFLPSHCGSLLHERHPPPQSTPHPHTPPSNPHHHDCSLLAYKPAFPVFKEHRLIAGISFRQGSCETQPHIC